MTVLLAFCSAPTNGVTEQNIAFCIPEASTLARTAKCVCYTGGRAARDRRSCGVSGNLVDLVCSGVSAVDLPADEVYDHLTCL